MRNQGVCYGLVTQGKKSFFGKDTVIGSQKTDENGDPGQERNCFWTWCEKNNCWERKKTNH